MALLRVGPLPDAPLAAAASFHRDILPAVRRELADRADQLASDRYAPDHLTLVFAPADHTHRGWRVAAVEELAREYAPVRINALAADDEPAIAAATAYLASAPGLTGQLLPLDGTGAGPG